MSLDAAVVGAGVAGLACARRLQAAGLRVGVFDKGRGPGGRLASRRFETPFGEARADHGAQYVTAREPAFAALLQDLAQTGDAACWEARCVPPAPEPRWVGAPAMSALVRGMAAGLPVQFGAAVAAVQGGPGQWVLCDAQGVVLSRSRVLVCAVPAEQAAVLLRPAAPALAEEAAGAESAPCWAVLAVFAQPVDPGFDVLAGEAAGAPLTWLARDGSKPGRAGPPVWVAHAEPEWSARHVEDAPETAAARLRPLLAQRLGAEPALVLAHRWRYALVRRAAGSAYGWDAARGVGACGDWRLGPRVELAWCSGDALGAVIAAHFGQPPLERL